MKDRLTYEEFEMQMIAFLMHRNVTFELDEKAVLNFPTFNIFVADKKRKHISLILCETYHYVTICFENEDEEENDEFIIRDADLFVKVSQAKKEYEDAKVVKQEKKNFKLLKLLTGE